MITSSTGLPADVLTEIAELEQRVVAADGGRLKLEWGALRSRPADAANDVVVRDGTGRLIGFAGVYRWGPEPEITGMIDPVHRGQGWGSGTLDAVLALARDAPTALLVVPRGSAGGHRLAVGRGGVLDRSEHALVQRSAPRGGTAGPAGLRLRAATAADRDAVDRLLLDGFGDPRGAGDRLERTTVAELDGRVVACLTAERQGADAGVYGFVVAPEQRGRGLGRAVLGRTCTGLWAEGARSVGLEVEVRNERALGLYTSLGFEPVITEDYYRLATR